MFLAFEPFGNSLFYGLPFAFILYIIPIIIKCRFFIDDNCSVIGELNITPKPDNFRRIYVLFQADAIIDTDFNPKPLNVNPLHRSGFTVLEWGGSELVSLEKDEL